MSDTLDLTMYGDVAACQEAVRTAGLAETGIGDAVTDLGKASTDSASWYGTAADGFRAQVTDTSSDLEELKRRLTAAKKALSTFAGELTTVKNKLGDVRDYAVKNGLTVSGDTVTAPTEPGDAADDTAVTAYNDDVEHWNTAVSMAGTARTTEDNAHHTLTGALQETNGDGWFENLMEKLGFAPPDGMDGVTGTGWMLGLLGTGFGISSDAMGRAVLGRWQPWVKGADGKWKLGSPYGHSAWERFQMGLRRGSVADRDWRARPYKSDLRGTWGTAGKWVGRAGLALTAVTSGWEQWQADADDPSLDTGERVDRTATKAATTTAGAWAGAEGGAWIGGAIGTAICPGVGTVIGGAVGGLVGGIGGAMAGGAVGDFVNEQWDGAVHAVGDAGEAIGEGLSDAGDAIGEAASDVGDALSFWD